MNKLRFGHWIIMDLAGRLITSAYEPVLPQFPIVMEDHGDVKVCIKTGADRIVCALKHMLAKVEQIEQSGDYVREVFVAEEQ